MDGPYRVQVYPAGVGHVDTIAIVGPNGTVTQRLIGDHVGEQFNGWCGIINAAVAAERARAGRVVESCKALVVELESDYDDADGGWLCCHGKDGQHTETCRFGIARAALAEYEKGA